MESRSISFGGRAPAPHREFSSSAHSTGPRSSARRRLGLQLLADYKSQSGAGIRAKGVSGQPLDSGGISKRWAPTRAAHAPDSSRASLQVAKLACIKATHKSESCT